MHAIVRSVAGFAGLTLLFFAVAGCAPATSPSSSTDSSQGGTVPQSTDRAEVARALAVEAVELSRGPFIDPVRTSGTIAGTREAVIVSETQGIMEEVSFSLGDTLEAGEVLVSLDSSIQRLSREQAAAQLRSAQLELDTTRRLVEQGSASEVQLSRAEAAARGAEAAYEQAKKAFDDRTIEAPFSGRVASKGQGIDPGNFLAAGTQIARIIDTSRMQVTVTVGQRQVLYLREGAPARIQVAGCPDSIYDGVVSAIAAGSDPNTGGFSTVVQWKGECGPEVRAGMTADVTIQPRGLQDVLLVPAGAIVDTPEGPYVYRVEDGIARRRAVEIAERLGDRANVVSGVEEGDIIVTSALSKLEDGSPVQAEVIGTTEDLL